MKYRVIFWAQALDNRSPDQVEMNGELISSDSPALRSELVSFAARKMNHGIARSSSQDIRFASSPLYIALQARSADRDSLGRSSYVVCCARKNAFASGNELRKELLRFASSIGRTMDAVVLDQLESIFDTIKKNNRKSGRIALLVCAALLAIAIAWVRGRGI